MHSRPCRTQWTASILNPFYCNALVPLQDAVDRVHSKSILNPFYCNALVPLQDAVDRGWLRTGHPNGKPKMPAIIASAFEVCVTTCVCVCERVCMSVYEVSFVSPLQSLQQQHSAPNCMFTAQVVSALLYLHKMGIVHGDL